MSYGVLLHYHEAWPHQGLEQRVPGGTPPPVPSPASHRIVRYDRLGGLLHDYSRLPDRVDAGRFTAQLRCVEGSLFKTGSSVIEYANGEARGLTNCTNPAGI